MSRHPLSNYKTRRRYWQLKNNRLEKQERLVLNKLQNYLEGQKQRMLERLPKDIKALEDQIFNIEEEARIGRQVMFPVLEQVMREEGEETAGRFGVDFVMSSEINSYLSERTEFFTKKINETTGKQIASELQAAREAGEDYNQMGKRIDKLVEQTKKGRGRTIARTETHTAQTKANFEGYKQAGVETKIWSATFQNTRDTHAALDGEEVPMDRPFSNGLMFPGDRTGSPSEIVNCQCQI